VPFLYLLNTYGGSGVDRFTRLAALHHDPVSLLLLSVLLLHFPLHPKEQDQVAKKQT
jgi:hypothetical protein